MAPVSPWGPWAPCGPVSTPLAAALSLLGVTAAVLICFVPTLFAERWVAATAVPPPRTAKARIVTITLA